MERSDLPGGDAERAGLRWDEEAAGPSEAEALAVIERALRRAQGPSRPRRQFGGWLRDSVRTVRFSLGSPRIALDAIWDGAIDGAAALWNRRAVATVAHALLEEPHRIERAGCVDLGLVGEVRVVAIVADRQSLRLLVPVEETPALLAAIAARAPQVLRDPGERPALPPARIVDRNG